ncbi:MAG TPA: helix-turn-helix domain-containing protein [Desulfomonilia bacterium]|nr:helix-turn-helix domain-containing protein [Desulfomonilia bacterium]
MRKRILIQSARTSKGGFYNHFKSKEQLFLETLSVARKTWREKNLYGIEVDMRPFEKIRMILENYRDTHFIPTRWIQRDRNGQMMPPEGKGRPIGSGIKVQHR